MSETSPLQRIVQTLRSAAFAAQIVAANAAMKRLGSVPANAPNKSA